MRRARLGILVLLIGCNALAPACADGRYPIIKALTNDDVVYVQLEDDIAAYYQALLNDRPIPELGFYQYRMVKGDDLYDIAARLNVPYETIATANRLSRPEEAHEGSVLLVANTPGVFIPESPDSELELLMAAWREKATDRGETVALFPGSKRETFRFYQGERFQPLERAYFLGVLFRFPLDRIVVTSRYGMRVNPFTRKLAFHAGIDLAAPWGSNVYAAREGVVEYVGTSATYGNFVMLRHDGGYETLYGHLSSVSVSLNDRVTSGMILGKVGSTGESTGPHLHFEIRQQGHAEDPALLLPLDGQ